MALDMEIVVETPLDIAGMVNRARHQLEEVTGLPGCSTLEAAYTDEGWRVVVELLERRAIPDSMDMLARYEALLDEQGRMLNFNRIGLRRRMDAMERGC